MTDLTPSILSRRSALLALGGLSLLAACGSRETAATASELKDLRDRPVRPLTPGQKISIDDGRYLIALALIHPDPVSLLAAWSGDVNRISPDMYRAYVEKFPTLAALPKIPRSGEPFNLEAVLAAQPAMAVVSVESGPSDEQAGQLQAAGVPVAFIDFFNHPFENQARSLALLGALIGRGEQAAAFNAFKTARLDAISAKVATVPMDQRPTVFLEPHAMITPDCCNSPGRGNVGDYIAFVGGRKHRRRCADRADGQAEPGICDPARPRCLYRHRRPASGQGRRLRRRAGLHARTVAGGPAPRDRPPWHFDAEGGASGPGARPVAPADQPRPSTSWPPKSWPSGSIPNCSPT